jgi:hypothetical protein
MAALRDAIVEDHAEQCIIRVADAQSQIEVESRVKFCPLAQPDRKLETLSEAD